MCSVRNQSESCRRWATSSCTNLAKQSEQVSVLHACEREKKVTIYRGFGKCLIPSQEHADKIKRIIDILEDLPYVGKRGRAGERHGPEEVAKPSLESRRCCPKIAGNESMILLQECGETILPTETTHSKNVDGLTNTACSWTTSRGSRSTTRPIEENEIDTRTNLY